MRENNLTKANGARSECDNCGRALGPIELIPVLSFILQRGKCLNCGNPIDLKIWLSELLGVISAIPVFVYLQRTVMVQADLSWITVISVLLMVTVIGLILYLAIADLFTYSIPTNWTLVLTISLLAANLLVLLLSRTNSSLAALGIGGYQNLLAAVLYGAGIYILIKISKERGIGMGDLYLAIAVGLYLGWPRTLSAFYITVITALVAGTLMAIKRGKWHGTIVPLVPFFLIGTAYAAVFGYQIFDLLFPGLNLWLN